MRVSMKPSVRISKLAPQMALALSIVVECFRDLGINEVVITSGEDSRHKPGSKHYTGNALDFRTHHVPRMLLKALVLNIKEALSPDFDVLLESQDEPNEHLHVEFDPKPQPPIRSI